MFSVASQASDDLQRRQAELQQLQSQISQQQSSLQNASKQREQLQGLLKQDEQAIARVAQKANETEKNLNQVDRELTTLGQRQQQLDQLKSTQQKTLSKQLASAYLTGNHDYAKMLLNQQDPAAIERMLAYYQYLNKARMQAINSLKITLEELADLQQKEQAKRLKLNGLMLDLQQETKQLKQEQQQREQTLTQLQRVLRDKGAQLEQMQINEASIKRMLAQAAQEARENPTMDGLAKLKGKLKWPTKGRIRYDYGDNRSGGVHWKGITLSAPEGREIHAVAPGKVIYADWMRGFGMVMVIDHGKGYMSLYGHAQTLLKTAGETVSPKDVIALVGNSGGQAEPGLYFEIRHKGQAMDPARFCS
ncbi:non-catalytic member of peptidase subfamily M23B [Shewanella sp. NFH-SH190041]|nr:peptidoglycan DD-metalloendopeptidase family protein [Shewanella sp. NFH-SH190041]BDM62667.1 non-catalytic member of peptidase subfamily M23B [Shewanella sp. NFH-SH190041]